MKRSFLSFAVFACLAAASAAWSDGYAVVAAVRTVARNSWDYLMDRVPITPSDPASEPAMRPGVVLIQARQFVARQIKREAPRVTQDCRMCLSV